MGGKSIMKKRITLGIVALVLGAWAILPDPAPFVVDDVIAGIGGSIALLKLIGSFMNKNP